MKLASNKFEIVTKINFIQKIRIRKIKIELISPNSEKGELFIIKLLIKFKLSVLIFKIESMNNIIELMPNNSKIVDPSSKKKRKTNDFF